MVALGCPRSAQPGADLGATGSGTALGGQPALPGRYPQARRSCVARFFFGTPLVVFKGETKRTTTIFFGGGGVPLKNEVRKWVGLCSRAFFVWWL